jgi:hypothetical protein
VNTLPIVLGPTASGKSEKTEAGRRVREAKIADDEEGHQSA